MSSNSTSNTPGPPSNNESSALYLFTFLATLLLLLAVSCAIVIRSFILRRRLRRHMEEMIAAGVMMPGALDDFPGGRGRRREFGEKPKLWEVWVDEQGQIHEGSESDFGGKEEAKWEDILPVSAIVLSKSKADEAIVASKAPSRRAILSRILARRPELPTPTLPEAVLPNDKAEDDLVQVSVLISMPNPNTRRSDATDVKGKERRRSIEEGELPDVVLGTAEVGYRVQ